MHPGVTLESIKKETPWDLKVTEDLTQTEAPTEKEISFVRNFAPTESINRKIMYELAVINVLKKAQARQQVQAEKHENI